MEGRSRDVYSNRRMQNVLCCRFSLDGKFVCSGSSDMCVRIWKANASEPLGPRPPRERRSLDYRNKLMEKYKALPEIKRIQRHHHVPALILKQKKLQQEKSAAKRRRVNNYYTVIYFFRRLTEHSSPKMEPSPKKRKNQFSTSWTNFNPQFHNISTSIIYLYPVICEL